jgi:hypothetical protein
MTTTIPHQPGFAVNAHRQGHGTASADAGHRQQH